MAFPDNFTTNAQTIRSNEKRDMIPPTTEATLRGTVLKDVIPSHAKAIILRKGYFVSPASLSCLS